MRLPGDQKGRSTRRSRSAARRVQHLNCTQAPSPTPTRSTRKALPLDRRPGATLAGTTTVLPAFRFQRRLAPPGTRSLPVPASTHEHKAGLGRRACDPRLRPPAAAAIADGQLVAVERPRLVDRVERRGRQPGRINWSGLERGRPGARGDLLLRGRVGERCARQRVRDVVRDRKCPQSKTRKVVSGVCTSATSTPAPVRAPCRWGAWHLAGDRRHREQVVHERSIADVRSNCARQARAKTDVQFRSRLGVDDVPTSVFRCAPRSGDASGTPEMDAPARTGFPTRPGTSPGAGTPRRARCRARHPPARAADQTRTPPGDGVASVRPRAGRWR